VVQFSPSKFIDVRLLQLVLALLGWLPITRAATTEVQSRFEKSLRAATSMPCVEAEWLDTLSITDPDALRAMRISEQAFVRIVRYSYIARIGDVWKCWDCGCEIVFKTRV
jgi:hypothetical protein